MEFPVSYLTLQALGFATGTALCWLVAALLWRSEDLAGSRTLWTALPLVCSLWPLGSFAMQIILLAGLREDSWQGELASVVAWSSTFLSPPLWLSLFDQFSDRRPKFRRALLIASAVIGAGLTIAFPVALLVQGFPLNTRAIKILSAYSGIGHQLAAFFMYGLQSGAASRFISSVFLPLAAVQISVILIIIHGQLPTAAVLTLLFVAQQSTIPTAIVVASFLAKFRYADVLLKRSLSVLLSVVVASLAVWWLPGIQPGIPVVAASLAGAALLLVSPLLHRALGRFVDRKLLRRPDYAALVRDFAAETARVGSEAELFALTETTIRDQLHLDSARVAARADTGAKIAGHRIPTRSGDPPYMLLIPPGTGGRRLLDEEANFLQAVGREVGRRLETLQFERDRRERQLREERLRHSLTGAELKALRAQVDPHFLFNTLNTIADLITSDPATAEAMTERLAEFFRYTLTRSEATMATLEQELQFVRHYLEIERVRFGSRLRVDLSAGMGAEREMVPALILQPLVENAIRHGLAPKVEGGTITVSAVYEDRFVRLQVADDGVGLGDEPACGNGIGLQNVRERLHALYGDAARMSIESDPLQGTCVNLWLPRNGS